MRDRMSIAFGCLNLLQGALVGAIPLLVPSRATWINALLAAAAIAMLVSGPALAFFGRPGRILAALACLFHGLLGICFAALTAASASYLYAIYGGYGRSAGALAFVIAAIGLVLFWLIPAHELRFLRNRQASR